MVKVKIWYSATVKADDSEEDIFDSFPEEIKYEAKRGKIKLIKESSEVIGDDMSYM